MFYKFTSLQGLLQIFEIFGSCEHCQALNICFFIINILISLLKKIKKEIFEVVKLNIGKFFRFGE